jgi:hypothetical protein
MTTDVEQKDALFERWCEPKLPLYLAGSGPALNYPGTPKEWTTDKAVVISQLRRQWAAALEKGFTAEELVGDAPMPEVYMTSGKPVRGLEPSVSGELSAKANRLLHEAASRRLRLDPIEEGILQRVAGGQGNPRTAAAIIDSVRGQIQAHDYKAQAVREEIANQPIVTVRTGFRAKGVEYSPGQHRITIEAASQLVTWQQEMEAQARQHGWDAPHGYQPDSWPPFVLDRAVAPAVREPH